MRYQVTIHPEPDSNFIIVTPTYKIFRQATEPRFLEYFSDLGEYNKTDSILNMAKNRKIYLRTLHDPNAIEGITNVRAIWADELGMMTSKAWTNIEGRSAVKQAQIFGTTTPYALNWLYRDIYKPWQAGKRDDVEFVQFRSIDNPYFPKEEFERQRQILDERVFAMKYEGQFRRMAGLVFMDFDYEFNQTDDYFVPTSRDYFICAGVDWGFTNQFAVTVRAIHKTEPRDYQIAEFYQSYLSPSEKVKAAKQLQALHGIEMWYADNEAPDMIKEFNSAGLSCQAAPKYPGSLVDNIGRHLTIIKTREHKLFKGRCPHTIDEYETYHYKEDDGKEENSPEVPVDTNNHLMTANMYVTQMTTHLRAKHKELQKVPLGRTRLQRLLDGEFAQKKEDSWYNG